jgi:hypothetical protein
MIEKEIMAYCFRKHKAMKSKLFKEVAWLPFIIVL